MASSPDHPAPLGALLAIADVPTGHVDTLYGRLGDWFMIPVALMLLVGIAGSFPRRGQTSGEAAQPNPPEPARAA